MVSHVPLWRVKKGFKSLRVPNMSFLNIWDNQNLIETLRNGGVVVMPTDTIYGIVGRAEDMDTVERIYKIKKRNREKPCIILFSDIEDLKKFSVEITKEQEKILKEFFPASVPTSVILDCTDDKFVYLHRTTNTLAFRLPNSLELQNLIKQTGPLLAPSANTEGLPPSVNINEAKNYFGDSVDLYVDGGEIVGRASKIIKMNTDDSVTTIRD